jgi:uncharacterized protein (DUF433 family)
MGDVAVHHIEITPGVCGGKPRIAGHRITVQDIAIWHERLGRSVDEIATEYDLTLAEIYAALSYYHDHREEIDRSIREGEAFVEELRRRTPSKLSARSGG